MEDEVRDDAFGGMIWMIPADWMIWMTGCTGMRECGDEEIGRGGNGKRKEKLG